jgi:phosphotransferase system HPr-like phosphotransfer protein
MKEILAYIIANPHEVVSAISALLTAGISIALIIPGEQPEKALQAIVDFLAKFSKK